MSTTKHSNTPCDLRQLRLRKGLSQQDLAKACGISNSWLCRLEKGAEVMGPKAVTALAETLGEDTATIYAAHRASVRAAERRG